MDDNSTSDDDYNVNAAEIKEALENLKAKNVELRENVNYLKIENLSYKQRYQSLKQNLTNLSRLLEQNTQIYSELFDDTRSALEIARVSILASPNVRNESSHRPPVQEANNEKAGETNTQSTNFNNECIDKGKLNIVSQQIIVKSPNKQRKIANQETMETQQNSPKIRPCTSNVGLRCSQRKKIPIEPINMQELQIKIREAENETKDINKTGLSFEDRLTTIAEEETLSKTLAKTLSVRLTRLSPTIVHEHLKKEESVASNNTTLNDLEFSTRSNPTFTSTPLEKLDIMRTLGLMPSPKNNSQVPNFVSVRKKEQRTRLGRLELLSSPKKERISLISPKKENSGSSKENFSPKSNNSNRKSRKRRSLSTTPKIKKKRKTNEEAPGQSSRPNRKARPRDMKEKSVRTKMRRS